MMEYSFNQHHSGWVRSQRIEYKSETLFRLVGSDAKMTPSSVTVIVSVWVGASCTGGCGGGVGAFVANNDAFERVGRISANVWHCGYRLSRKYLLNSRPQWRRDDRLKPAFS